MGREGDDTNTYLVGGQRSISCMLFSRVRSLFIGSTSASLALNLEIVDLPINQSVNQKRWDIFYAHEIAPDL